MEGEMLERRVREMGIWIRGNEDAIIKVCKGTARVFSILYKVIMLCALFGAGVAIGAFIVFQNTYMQFRAAPLGSGRELFEGLLISLNTAPVFYVVGGSIILLCVFVIGGALWLALIVGDLMGKGLTKILDRAFGVESAE